MALACGRPCAYIIWSWYYFLVYLELSWCDEGQLSSAFACKCFCLLFAYLVSSKLYFICNLNETTLVLKILKRCASVLPFAPTDSVCFAASFLIMFSRIFSARSIRQRLVFANQHLSEVFYRCWVFKFNVNSSSQFNSLLMIHI